MPQPCAKEGSCQLPEDGVEGNNTFLLSPAVPWPVKPLPTLPPCPYARGAAPSPCLEWEPPLRPRWTPWGHFWGIFPGWRSSQCLLPAAPIPLACTEHWEAPGKEISPSLWTASHRGTDAAALNELFSHFDSRSWRFRCQLLSSQPNPQSKDNTTLKAVLQLQKTFKKLFSQKVGH